jgi:pimeloyl-ACP methyl ester carboxylesterase
VLIRLRPLPSAAFIALWSVAFGPLTAFGQGTSTASPEPAQRPSERDRRVQTTFESVDAVIAAQWDFPERSPAPLVVLIPSQGRLDRDGSFPGLAEGDGQGMYAELANALVAAGFAVFRFDKPGAGRSAPGRFATERSNAIEAYTRAVDHARVDRDNVFLLAHSAGSDAVAGIYSRYEAVVAPRGVVFLDNAVGERMSLDVKAPLLIVNPNNDPDDRYTHGQFVVESRNVAPEGKLSTELILIDGAEPGLLAPNLDGAERFELHPRAITVTIDWLRKAQADAPASVSVPPPSAPHASAALAAAWATKHIRFADPLLLASPRPGSVN